MGLILKQEIAEREYKKYEKLTDSFTFEEGKTYSLASMDRLSSKVLTHIWERKQILKDVVAYYKEGTESKEKEDALQKRLNENDEYFMNLTEVNKEKFIEFFEHTSDKLAKIPAWQSYHMLYVELLGVGLKKQINDSISRIQEMEEKVKTYEDVEKRKNDSAEDFSSKYPAERAKEILDNQKELTDELKNLEEQKETLKKGKAENAKLLTSQGRKKDGLEDDLKAANDTLDTYIGIKNDLENYFAEMERKKEETAALKKDYEDRIQDLENAKKELANQKDARKEVLGQYRQAKENWYAWGENYGTANLEEKTDEEKKVAENLKRNTSARKKRDEISVLRDAIGNLKNIPEYALELQIYGGEDSELREKYPILDWIKKYMELKKDSEELKARQLKEEEEAELNAEETDGVENETTEEMKTDGVENETTEKKEVKIGEVEVVEGKTTYAALLTAMYDDLDKIDDIYWDEITTTSERLPEDVKTVYDAYDNKVDDFIEELDKRDKEIATQEKAVDNFDVEMGAAKKTYHRWLHATFYGYINDRQANTIGIEANPEELHQQAVEKVKEVETKIKEKTKVRDEYRKAHTELLNTIEEVRKEVINKDYEYDAKIEQVDLSIKEKTEKLERNTPLYNGLMAAREEYEKVREEYNKVREETFKYAPKEIDDLQPGIKQQANEWLKKAQTYADKHKNSKEFDAMINALKMAADWPDIKKYTEGMAKEDIPKDKTQVANYLKQQAEKYQKAKNDQWRFFPSRLRTHRLNMVNSIIELAEDLQKGHTAQKEEEYLKTFFEGKGELSRKEAKDKVDVKYKKEAYEKEQKEKKAEKTGWLTKEFICSKYQSMMDKLDDFRNDNPSVAKIGQANMRALGVIDLLVDDLQVISQEELFELEFDEVYNLCENNRNALRTEIKNEEKMNNPENQMEEEEIQK